MKRIAPNNNLPATHFIESWIWNGATKGSYSPEPTDIEKLYHALSVTKQLNGRTVAIFRIRENKLPTLHKF